MPRTRMQPDPRWLLAGLLIIVLAGCGGDEEQETPPADLGWGFTAVWGTGADDLITVGFDFDREQPFVHRRTGGEWRTSWLDVTDLVAEYRSLFGEDTQPEFILRSVGGTAANLHAVGDLGIVYRFDGTAWQRVFSDLRLADWRGVWGDDMETYVAGTFGKVLHGTGDGYQVVNPFGDDGPDLHDVWGVHVDNLWVAGESVARFTGVNWSTAVIPQPVVFLCIHGRAYNDVYMGTAQGDIYRFDGQSWSPDHTHAGGTITGIFVFADGRVMALSPRADGTDILMRTDDQWSVQAVVDVQLWALWGATPDDVYAVGSTATQGVLYHWDGAWTQEETKPLAPEGLPAAGIAAP